jgi:hypothetical protein
MKSSGQTVSLAICVLATMAFSATNNFLHTLLAAAVAAAALPVLPVLNPSI